jgi:hypothetical protein
VNLDDMTGEIVGPKKLVANRTVLLPNDTLMNSFRVSGTISGKRKILSAYLTAKRWR